MTTTSFFSFDRAAANPGVNGVLDITPEDLKPNLNQVYVVDVRRPDEWVGEFGHIEQATLMTLDTLPMRADELPKDKTIVFVCRSGGRSAQASAWAKENGFSHVYNMQGGMIEWAKKNYQAVDINQA